MARRLCGLAAALLGVLLPRDARAEVFSLWGAGPAAMSEAGARVARAEDGWAAHLNPAGLAASAGALADAGVLLATSRLRAAGLARPLDEGAGVVASLAADLPGFAGGPVRIGFAFHTPPTTLLRVRARAEAEPQFPAYDNRSQRLVAIPALAVRPVSWLSFGASLDALAGLTGNASLQPGPRGAGEPRVDQRVTPTLRPIVGVRAAPARWLRIGAVYRGEFAVNVDTTTDATLAGVPIQAVVRQEQALFDPATVALGAAVLVSPRLEFELDGAYQRWSSYRGPLLHVEASLPAVNGQPASQLPAFQDTFSARLGASVQALAGPHVVWLRAGAGYESSLLGDRRQGNTNLVDADKVIVGLGAAYELTRHRLSVGLGAQAHLLRERSWTKVACAAAPCSGATVAGPDASAPAEGITDPGFPTLRASGSALALSLTVGTRW